MSLNIITKNIIKTCMTKVGLIQTRSYETTKKELKIYQNYQKNQVEQKQRSFVYQNNGFQTIRLKIKIKNFLNLKKLQKIIQ